MGYSLLYRIAAKITLAKQFRHWLTVSLLCLCVVSVSGAYARPIDEVTDSGYITVFVYEDYAPYSWKDESGELHGIDVEIARHFAESLDVEIRFLIRGADENVDDDLRINLWLSLIHI